MRLHWDMPMFFDYARSFACRGLRQKTVNTTPGPSCFFFSTTGTRVVASGNDPESTFVIRIVLKQLPLRESILRHVVWMNTAP